VLYHYLGLRSDEPTWPACATRVQSCRNVFTNDFFRQTCTKSFAWKCAATNLPSVTPLQARLGYISGGGLHPFRWRLQLHVTPSVNRTPGIWTLLQSMVKDPWQTPSAHVGPLSRCPSANSLPFRVSFRQKGGKLVGLTNLVAS